MIRLLNNIYIFTFLVMHFACVHKEINIKEVYFRQEFVSTKVENKVNLKQLEKCTPGNEKIGSEFRFNNDSNDFSKIIDEAFIQSKQSSWYDVEIHKAGKPCIIFKGKYYEK